MGYYCGKNAVQNVALNYDPEGYVNYILDLAMNGSAHWNNKGARTKLDKTLQASGLGGRVEAASEIFGASLNASTYKKSPLRGIISGLSQRMDQDEEPGNTHPYEMKRILKRVGLRAETKSIYKKHTAIDVVDIYSATKRNLIPIVLENHGITRGTPNPGILGFVGYHYLAIQSISHGAGGMHTFIWNEYGSDKTGTRTSEQFAEGTRAYFIIIKR